MPRNTARQFKFLVLFAILIGSFQNCGYIAAPMDPSLIAGQLSSFGSGIAFSEVQSKVLNDQCVRCHSATTKSGNLDLSSYTATMRSVVAGKPDSSGLYRRVADSTMPAGGPALSSAGQQLIYNWILSGAKETAEPGQPTQPGGGENRPPTVSAGVNQTIRLPTTSLTLYGSATDPDGLLASFQWTKVSGGAATLTGASTATLVASGLSIGTYVFRLTVVDNGGARVSADATVTVLSATAATPTPTPVPTPTPTPTPVPAVTATYSSLKVKVFDLKCVGCHDSMKSHAGLTNNSSWIVKNNANSSGVYTRTNNDTMPAGGLTKLTTAEKTALQTWINNGAQNN